MKAPIEVINTHDQVADYILTEDSVQMTVYPRVHMFPIDLSVISGIIKNGSIGYSLRNMPIEVSVRKNTAAEDSIQAAGNVDINNLDLKIDFSKLRSYIGSHDHYDVTISVKRGIREHTGLGVSTQILGSIYLCCAKLSGTDFKIHDLYKIGLGHHSALGLNLLFNPGMILEVGTVISKNQEGIIANPTISQEYEIVANTVYKINRFPFYSIIAIPKDASSITDQYGDDFFNSILPVKAEDTQRIVYNIFEKLIPGIVESNYDQFIEALQENTAIGIKQFESSYQSPRLNEVLGQMRETFGFASVSSIGPTLYAFSEKDPAESLAKVSVPDYDFFVSDPSGRIKKKIGSDETLLISAFATMGKTTFAKQHPDLALDVESIHYARNYVNQDPDDEIAKNDTNWTENPLYPHNYVQDVIDNIGKYRVIFLTLGQNILAELDKKGIKYSILYPGSNRTAQVLRDSKARGNDDDFVKMLEDSLLTSDHRLEFEAFDHERFEIIDDDTYIEKYLKDNYYL